MSASTDPSSETAVSSAPDHEPPRVAPMPRALGLGAAVGVLGLVVAGFWIFALPSLGSRDAASSAAVGANVEASAEEGTRVAESGVVAPPEAIWLEDALDALHQQVERLESNVRYLEQRHGTVAAGLDTLMADAPWHRQTPGIERMIDAVQAQQERGERLERQWEAVRQRVEDLAAVQQTLVERRDRARSAPQRPPFAMIAIDWWNGEPYAVLVHEGAYARLPVGERLGGWQLETLEPVGRSAVFARAGQRVTLQAEEG